jgi:glucosamine--fructose-6-phosphate aminotransferase (isomerizing)
MFPKQVVAVKRGSPLLVGIKSERNISMDKVNVSYRERHNSGDRAFNINGQSAEYFFASDARCAIHSLIFTDIVMELSNQIFSHCCFSNSEIEWQCLVSNYEQQSLTLSALIEHTDRVIYLEDDDVTSIVDGSKLFHNSKCLSVCFVTYYKSLICVCSEGLVSMLK